jgi:hypothetical protein
MPIKTEADIKRLINDDPWMMNLLQAAQTLGLPDWWICAGVVRARIWDALAGFPSRIPVADVDVIYFDRTQVDESTEKRHEEALRGILPDIPWSVKNEARMHIVNGLPPYSSAVDAIAKFPETVTAVGLTLDHDGHLVLAAPHGLDDLLHFHVRPTPYFAETIDGARTFAARLAEKRWGETWEKVFVTQPASLTT